MDDKHDCLFCIDQGCGVCGAVAMPPEPEGVTTRCTRCCDAARQCSQCASIDSGEVTVDVDLDTHNVIGIFDRRPIAGTIQDDDSQPFRDEVIEILEHLLDEAREGKFTGIAAVLDGYDGLVTLASLGAVEDPIIFLGGLSRVAHNIQKETDLDED